MMQRVAVFIMAIMLLMLGCSLTTGATNPAPNTPTQMPTLTVLAAQPSTTPTQAGTATPTTRPPNTPIPVVNCTPRSDWPFYSVAAGDTLGSIAQRTGSTVANLTAANCLANADNIYVGQLLRVPRTPTVPTLTPAPSLTPAPTSMDNTPRILSFELVSGSIPPRLEWYTNNVSSVTLSVSGPRGSFIGYGTQAANGTFLLPKLGMDFAPRATFILGIKDMAGRDVIGPNGLPVTARVDVETGPAPLDCPTLTDTGTGTIGVSPVLGMVGRCSHIKGNQTVWVTWENVSGLTSAEYYFLPVIGSACGASGNPNVIGTDSNMADGNMITWYIGPGPCAGILYAFGYTNDTMVESRQHALVVYNQ